MIADDLPPEAEVAVGYARPEHKATFAALLAFDRNLSRSVAGASEAIVGQLRLAWWRDAMATRQEDLPCGNPLLDQLASGFKSHRPRLGALVDGWEAVLLAEPIGTEAAKALCEGREDAWHALADAIGAGAEPDAVRVAARRWALADFVSGLPAGAERDSILAEASTLSSRRTALPKSLRPLAVLDALARRSLAAGGAPLLAGRASAIAALRSGLFGR